MTRKYETCTHGAGPILWPVALQHQQTASNRPWIATGDGTTDTIHKFHSKQHTSQSNACLVGTKLLVLHCSQECRTLPVGGAWALCLQTKWQILATASSLRSYLRDIESTLLHLTWRSGQRQATEVRDGSGRCAGFGALARARPCCVSD